MNSVTVQQQLTTVDLTARIGSEIKTDVATMLSGAHAAHLAASVSVAGGSGSGMRFFTAGMLWR